MSPRWLLLVALVISLTGCSRDLIKVESVFPEEGAVHVSTSCYIVVALEEELPEGSGPGLVETDPMMPGNLQVDGNKIVFQPSGSWQPDTTYRVTYRHPQVRETSWTFTTGDLDEAPAVLPEATGLGPFGQVMSVGWTTEGRLAAIIRDQAVEAMMIIGPGSEQETVFETDSNTFYMAEPLADGLGVVYSSLEDGKVWHGTSSGAKEVATGLVFQVSPDRKRAVVYDVEAKNASLVDFTTGKAVSLPSVPVWEFPYTGQDSGWSPDSRHFLYRADADGVSRIEIIDVETDRVVTSIHYPGGRCIFPEWAPQGDAVAFLVLEDEGSNTGEVHGDLPLGHRLGVAKLEGSVIYHAPELGMVVGSPVWSPDGQRIAFAAGEIDNGPDNHFPDTKVHAVGIDGLPQRLNAPLMQGYARPLCFSPDGAHLMVSLYVSHGSQPRDTAFLVTPDGDTSIHIGEIGGAVWVDEDRLVIWFLERQMGSDVWLIDAWGGFVKALSEEGWLSHGMALSPDASSLAFVAYNPGESGEYVVVKELP